MRQILSAERISELTLKELQDELAQHEFAVKGYSSLYTPQSNFYTPEEKSANEAYTLALKAEIQKKTPPKATERTELELASRTPSPAKHSGLLSWMAKSGGVLRAAEEYHDQRAHFELPELVKPRSPR